MQMWFGGNESFSALSLSKVPTFDLLVEACNVALFAEWPVFIARQTSNFSYTGETEFLDDETFSSGPRLRACGWQAFAAVPMPHEYMDVGYTGPHAFLHSNRKSQKG